MRFLTVITLLLTTLCSCRDALYFNPVPDTNGWLVVEDGELRPGKLPGSIAGDESLEYDNLTDIPALTMEWWNDQVGEQVFDKLAPHRMLITTNFVTGPNAIDDDVEAETTLLQWDADLNITKCLCALNYDLAYDRDTMIIAARHCAGHCLALGDDFEGLDVYSIMSNPMDPLGIVTEYDRNLIRDWIQQE